MGKARILIVDDEAFNVDYLEQELEEKDYETISASNGKEALEMMRAKSPDLVLLDIMMPVMDGFEVLTRVKAEAEISDIPVIVISADNNLQSVVRGIELGAEDYLPKPFEQVLLHARISSSLEKKRLRDLQKLYLKSLEREFDIAREIQQGFLPADLPQVVGWETAAYFKAAKEVAGDFYDVFQLSNGNLMCVVGDVCGKGVGASLFMTLFRSLIRASATTDEFILKKDGNPLNTGERLQHIIQFTNNYIADVHRDANMFATVFIGILDITDGSLTYINCGNEPGIILGSSGVKAELGPTGPVIGLFAGTNYDVARSSLCSGDALLAFTDGIPDALDPGETAYGRERLLASLKSETSAIALIERIRRSLQGFIGGAEQFDDITLLAIYRI
jgi:serine phosphatase RsbU (regulator of sigma subunit)